MARWHFLKGLGNREAITAASACGRGKQTWNDRADLVGPGHLDIRLSMLRATRLPTQHKRQTPQEAQQDPQATPQPQAPPQPRQARQPAQRQPRQPRQPPQPRHATCTPLPTFSLSKTWNVARLTSAISSSPSMSAKFGARLVVCCTSAIGTADADAPPVSEKVKPAAPSAGKAALVTRFFVEACFTRDIVASSIRGNKSFPVHEQCHCTLGKSAVQGCLHQ